MARVHYNKDMLYSVFGKLALKSENFAVVEAGGLGVKLFVSKETLKALPAVGTPSAANIKFFTHLYVREDMLDLYGFATEEELHFFQMLISVSGIGPKSALSILDVAPLHELSAAIKEGRPDLLTRASGIGHKTAERVIVELRSKVESAKSGLVVEKMQTDVDLVEALVGLGYRKEEARAALGKVDMKVSGTEDRLKAALVLLSKKN
jgi:Holliday junction DNA helicase RuvA